MKKIQDLAEFITVDFNNQCTDRYCGNGCGYDSEEYDCRIYFTLKYLEENGLLKEEEVKI